MKTTIATLLALASCDPAEGPAPEFPTDERFVHCHESDAATYEAVDPSGAILTLELDGPVDATQYGQTYTYALVTRIPKQGGQWFDWHIEVRFAFTPDASAPRSVSPLNLIHRADLEDESMWCGPRVIYAHPVQNLGEYDAEVTLEPKADDKLAISVEYDESPYTEHRVVLGVFSDQGV